MYVFCQEIDDTSKTLTKWQEDRGRAGWLGVTFVRPPGVTAGGRPGGAG